MCGIFPHDPQARLYSGGAEQAGGEPDGEWHGVLYLDPQTQMNPYRDGTLDLDPQTRMNPDPIGIGNSAYNDA